MAMTPEAKRLLSSTVRDLRERLLADLEAELDRAYRLTVRAQDAGLDEVARIRRRRLEQWCREEVRAETRPQHRRTEIEFRRQAVQQAASTLLNRLVVLRLLEASGLRKPAVVTSGWGSRGYLDFRQVAPALVQEHGRGDASEGYGFLLQLVFEDVATDLPGLFGPAGVADLVPIPAATLRYTIEWLDQEGLASCWTDDMTLGWVYQYWNDPEREALDAKLNAGGKVEPHEIASKTQMFTERYIVDWLLQNSLGPMWLAMCRKHGWVAQVEALGPDGLSTLNRLEERRVQWRAKRDAGEISLTELMPLHSAVEERWAYYVPQPIPDDAVTYALDSVRDLRLLDPAVGSGHFLVVAFELLAAIYREEAEHRGEAADPRWSDSAIVERILEQNLHGIDLDPRAVQIAAAALWLKAQQLCPEARPRQMNLVASSLRLASLPGDDPALVELRREVEAETGIPAALTDTLVHALQGADHLGSLLRVDRAVEAAIRDHEGAPVGRLYEGSGKLLEPEARRTLLDRLEDFLARHGSGDDLGLRLRGEQLAAGVRFVRMLREGTYDLVAGNPPYQGTSKMADTRYIEEHYSRGKADLYAAFLDRGLQLARVGGVSALLTMRNWMFIRQYIELRKWILASWDLRALGDFAVGAFDEVPNDLLSVVVSVFRRSPPDKTPSVALQLTSPDQPSYDRARTKRKRAATLCQSGRHEFEPPALRVVPAWPLVYWWTSQFLGEYGAATLLEAVAPVRIGMKTSNNGRYVRFPFEVQLSSTSLVEFSSAAVPGGPWVPYIQGAAGRCWIDPVWEVVWWEAMGLEIRLSLERAYGSGPQCEFMYFMPGVACSTVGNHFSARLHRRKSIFSTAGTSVFPKDRARVLTLLNCSTARRLVQDLNPGLGFEVGDINRVPYWQVSGSEEIVENLDQSFTVHESHREPSVEFRRPGSSSWRHAQDWAQAAVDRPKGAPLPRYEPTLDAASPTDHLSFAFGIALGRFGPGGEGILDPSKDPLGHALPAGICFLDGTLDSHDGRDSLGQPAAEPLHSAWSDHTSAMNPKSDLRTWLRLRFFSDVHRGTYQNRPIHWPLSSAARTFVAWVTIHRLTSRTLRVLLADHLAPVLTRLDGQLADLRAARDGVDVAAARAADRRYDNVLRQREELLGFIAAVEACADQGPPPTDAQCPVRELDARYEPNLDDGVMINSAALWPLLEPQWKDPKKWWKELASGKGRENYDWSHLAMCYWPTRVDAMCQEDPSLAVAHGCFWRYHAVRAWAWELRLQGEIRPDFRIEEPPYRPGGRELGDQGDQAHRTVWIRDHAVEALAAVEKEAIRRMGRGEDKRVVPEMWLLETGLWSSLPAEAWELELRLASRQEALFSLRAPDEEEGRRRVAELRPDLVHRWQQLLADLATPFDEPSETCCA